MNRKKQFTALTCAAVLTLSLAACGGGNGAGTTPSGAPADPLATAQEKMASVTSMDAQMVMLMDLDVNGQTMSTTTTMDMTYFSDPIHMKADMKVEVAGVGATANT